MGKGYTDKAERKTAKLGRAAHHYKRLLDAMGGKPEDWEYKGEHSEDKSGRSKCACGHPIVNLYTLRHKVNTNQIVIVGSVCVTTAPFMPSDVVENITAHIEAIKKELAERKRAERDTKAFEEFQAYDKRMKIAHEKRHDIMSNRDGRKVAYSLYCFHSYQTIKWESYKRKSAAVSAYKKLVERLEHLLKTPYESWN